MCVSASNNSDTWCKKNFMSSSDIMLLHVSLYLQYLYLSILLKLAVFVCISLLAG